MNNCCLLGLTVSIACVLLCAVTLGADRDRLEARVEVRDGVPTLLVNGEAMPPFMLFHTAGGGARAMACPVTPEWQQFSYTFVAPCNDDTVGLHINCVTPEGDWFVDDARFFEGTLKRRAPGNLLRGGDFEGDKLPDSWTYFLSSSTGAKAEYSLDTTAPHGGRSCLRVHIAKRGTVSYHIHIYQRVTIKEAKTYTFSVWLRASDEREIYIKAVHQAPPWTVYGGQSTASDRILRLGAERGLHIGTPPIAMPWPRDGSAPHYSMPDRQVDHILAVDPDALIVPRIRIDPPAWWKQANPGNQQLYDKGQYPMASPASTLWRRDASHALRLFLRHLEAKYGNHMLGYHIGAQSANEWFYDHTWEKIMPCFEEPFRRAFAEWARLRYGTVAKLRGAWHQPDVTFETIRVPTLEERTAGKLGVFRDPQTQRFEIDFAEYMQVCLCEYLEECARIVKEETAGRKLSVFFYGYLFDVAGFAYGGAVSGHLRLRRALDCPHVDLFCAPISYFDRQSGGCGPFMAPVDSIQLHGKLWLNEDDTRTHLASKNAGFGRTQDLFETTGVYRRNFGHQFERRCATWWMDFGTGWMADAQIFDNFGKTQEVWQQSQPVGPYSPQVAVVVDEDSFLYLRNSNEITRECVNRMRGMFNTMGCPVGLYLMSDLCEGRLPASVRFFVFLNAFRVTAEQRQQLRRQVAKDGRVALWLYAPGYVGDKSADVGNVAELVGFEVREAAAAESSRVRLVPNRPTPLGALPPGHAFGVDFRPQPLFAVAPEQPEVLAHGTYAGTDEVALAARRFADWTSVFCGGLHVSAEVLRELARSAGVHICCETNDVISACPGFVSIHATSAGEKALLFAQPVVLRDLYSGETRQPAATRHSFQLRKGETRAFVVP